MQNILLLIAIAFLLVSVVPIVALTVVLLLRRKTG